MQKPDFLTTRLIYSAHTDNLVSNTSDKDTATELPPWADHQFLTQKDSNRFYGAKPRPQSLHCVMHLVGCFVRMKTNLSIDNHGSCLYVRVIALRPQQTAGVMSGRSVILTKLFLDKPTKDNLSVFSIYSFAIN